VINKTAYQIERATLIQTTHKIDTLYKEGSKIPTIVNGRIVKSEVRNCARKEEKARNIAVCSDTLLYS